MVVLNFDFLNLLSVKCVITFSKRYFFFKNQQYRESTSTLISLIKFIEIELKITIVISSVLPLPTIDTFSS